MYREVVGEGCVFFKRKADQNADVCSVFQLSISKTLSRMKTQNTVNSSKV